MVDQKYGHMNSSEFTHWSPVGCQKSHSKWYETFGTSKHTLRDNASPRPCLSILLNQTLSGDQVLKHFTLLELFSFKLLQTGKQIHTAGSKTLLIRIHSPSAKVPPCPWSKDDRMSDHPHPSVFSLRLLKIYLHPHVGKFLFP